MVKRKHKPKPLKQRKIALERVETLFKEAEKAFKDNPKLSNPGVNCRVRLGQKQVIYSCLECKKFMRFGYKKKYLTTSK